MIASVVAVGFASALVGCLDRQPAPVCPVPIEVANNKTGLAEFDGVDILAVVDNSGSMKEEQQILATGFFTLINSLANPTADWPYPEVSNIRLAVVSSNMGLQYGDPSSTEFSKDPKAVRDKNCDVNGMTGDDGHFLPIKVPGNVASVLSGQISCETGGAQCPAEYICDQGKCRSQDGTDLIMCPTLASAFAETTIDSKNTSFAAQTACLAIQGTEGCGFEQQLEAAVRGLERPENQSFIQDKHVLAVLIVSDEEDCSIQNPGLFSTTEWNNFDVNVACNYNGNDANLFSPDRYKEQFVALKGNNASAVIFAAIVGVPNDDMTCQGTGTELEASGCLAHPQMQYSLVTVDPTQPDVHYFAPACERFDANNVSLTQARPGQRYVKVAESFGNNGYVFSICNPDWSPAMSQIAGLIARQLEPECFPKKLEWKPLTSAETTLYPGCADCGFALCDAVMERFVGFEVNEADYCPASLYANLPPSEQQRYQSMITSTNSVQRGDVTGRVVTCPIPKLPSPIDCDAAEVDTPSRYANLAGWYYCQSSSYDASVNSCADGVDNDNNTVSDCDDPDCKSCNVCGGAETECREGCAYRVMFSETARQYSNLGTINIQCMQQSSLEDQNCQEDAPKLCGDGEDNDGNGLIDCDNTLLSGAPDAHAPDPNCCPMTEVDGKCVPDVLRVRENCGSSASVAGQPEEFWQIPANVKQIAACADQAERLACTW
jgi:hypothetical protein